MKEFFEFAGAVWGQAEWMLTLVGVILAGYVFLKDQIRRDRFFGYIPTVITVVYDPSQKKILVAHLNGGIDRWILPQGRIQGSILEAARQILSQELALERAYKLLGAQYLGRIALRREEATRLDRFMDPAEFTLARIWRGKAYTAIVVETKVEFALKELDGSFLYEEVRFVDLAEARDLLSTGHRPDKVQMYQKILAFLEGGNK